MYLLNLVNCFMLGPSGIESVKLNVLFISV